MMIRKLLIGAILLGLAGANGVSYANDKQLIEELRARLSDLEQRMAAYEAIEQPAVLGQRVSGETIGAGEMEVYGQIRVSADHRFGDFTQTGSSINSNASRIGIKGSSAWNIDHTQVIYQAELQYEATDSVDGNQSKQVEFREGFAGLSGDWGAARFGRLTTGYKTSLEAVDPWIDSALESHAGGRQGSSELHGNFFNNTVEYVSPAFWGTATASVWHASLFSDSSKPLHNTGTLRNYTGGTASGAGVKYRQGPLFLAADVIDLQADNITLAGLANGNGWQLSARYQWSNLAFGVFYEDVVSLGLGKNIYGNVIYTLGDTRLIASYSENSDASVYGMTELSNWNLGLKTSAGDNSEFVAAFNRNTDHSNSEHFDTFTIGLNTSFGR